ncbi:MAG: thioesterase [SAR324 cluster bacterium]|nr:thioesterase [SAR324 cluster bacterium]
MLQPEQWIVIPKPVSHAKLRLFCFPHAGGGIASFSQWIQHLPTDIEVCLILLPGRENRFKETTYTDINLLIHDLGEVLSGYLDRPYAFYGHSMGALVSFELARYLRRNQRPGPSHLFNSAHRAPQLISRFPPLHKLPSEKFLDTLRQLQGTPDEILNNHEMMELMYPTLQRDLQLCENYEYSPEPPLQCPITTYGGLKDHRTLPEELEDWGIHTYAAFQLHLLEGGHFFIQDSKEVFLKMFHQELTQLLFALR